MTRAEMTLALLPVAALRAKYMPETQPGADGEIPHCPHTPTAKQQQFLELFSVPEVFYGGAAGGGKSDALLMDALRNVDAPHYSALMLRRTYPQLWQPSGLIPRSFEWLSGSGARWNGAKNQWTFPSGATLAFGYLATEIDKYQYQGGEYQYVAFDELTQFTRSQYLYLFSRLRRLEGSQVPTRMRAAANPGGLGHEWVRQRFIEPHNDGSMPESRAYVPARIEDNPHLDAEDYERNLRELDPIERAQLLQGDWDIRPAGDYFDRSMFEIAEAAPADNIHWCRFWDFAASTPTPEYPDPDYTAGCLLGRCDDGLWYLADMQHFRAGPHEVEQRVKNAAALDSARVPNHMIRLEQEPGSSGKSEVDHFVRGLAGRDVRGIPSTGSKEVRARPVSAQARAGNIKIVQGPWIEEFLREAEVFPQGPHDDQIDALSGAFQALLRGIPGETRVYYGFGDENDVSHLPDPFWEIDDMDN